MVKEVMPEALKLGYTLEKAIPGWKRRGVEGMLAPGAADALLRADQFEDDMEGFSSLCLQGRRRPVQRKRRLLLLLRRRRRRRWRSPRRRCRRGVRQTAATAYGQYIPRRRRGKKKGENQPLCFDDDQSGWFADPKMTV